MYLLKYTRERRAKMMLESATLIASVIINNSQKVAGGTAW